MTREEFDKLDESTKSLFAKEGEELRSITEMTKEDFIREYEERQALINILKPENWGFDESGYLQFINASYGGKYE